MKKELIEEIFAIVKLLIHFLIFCKNQTNKRLCEWGDEECECFFSLLSRGVARGRRSD